MPIASAHVLSPIPQPQQSVTQDPANTLTPLWRNYLKSLDDMLRAARFGPLPAATDDAAAAAAGVPVDGFYHNAGVVQVRRA